MLYTVGKTPWTGDQSVANPLPTHRTTQTQNKRTETSIPRVGFEPTIQVFDRAKTVHALERAVAVTGYYGVRTGQWNAAVMVIVMIISSKSVD
jgi:hypothetical protein